jgi:DNA-binding LacI/PurR family transcriptional regulator
VSETSPLKETSVTVRDIAERVGVSIGTVSRALKNQPGVGEDTRHRILKTAERLGYDLGNLRPTKLRRVSFLHRGHYTPSNNVFYSPVLHGVEEACRKNDLVLSYELVTLEHPVTDVVRKHEADGLLCVSYFEPDVLDAIKSTGIPVVLVDHWTSDLPSVNGDNFNGTYQTAQHLIGLGHKRIAFISGPPEHYSIRERRRGYRQALYDDGIPADPALDLTRDPPELESGTMGAMNQLMGLAQPPDAVIAYNDVTAFLILRYLQERGIRVPEDIAVAGFDDVESARNSSPPLTTVRIDKEGLGRVGVELLLQGARSPKQSVSLPVKLMVRKSTKKTGGS